MLHFSQDLETRKFLVGPETFGLKLLVSFLVSVSVPVSPNFNFLVSFWYPFWRIYDFLVLFRYLKTYFRLFPSVCACVCLSVSVCAYVI